MNNIDFGAPDSKRVISVLSFMRLFPKAIMLVLLVALSIPLWPIYWLGCIVLKRPPNVPRSTQVKCYLILTWTVRPPFPGLSFLMRIGLTLSIIQIVLRTPIVGVAWMIDEILYGNVLDKIQVNSPVFVISGGRSGSTQLTRYLEDDSRLAAPNILQCMFPYLWLWRLIPRTIGSVITPEKVRQLIQASMPSELWERHEANPFRADTFDGPFYSSHLHQFSLFLGPEIAATDFNFALIADHDRQIKGEDFLAFVDRIARKTLLYAGSTPDATNRRFFIKGHFLYSAQSLYKYYPDARFLTIIREPISRIQSGVNYLRVNPVDPVLGPVPWAWLGATLEKTEVDYCEVEQHWFTQKTNGHRCVIKFTEFANDLEMSMKKVHRCCFNSIELPAHIPPSHPERERKNYSINRSLNEIGIDESKLRNRLTSYIGWCEN